MARRSNGAKRCSTFERGDGLRNDNLCNFRLRLTDKKQESWEIVAAMLDQDPREREGEREGSERELYFTD